MKVYCEECIYLNNDIRTVREIHNCTHKNNKRINEKENKAWLSKDHPQSIQFIEHPSHINKNNDCENFCAMKGL